ncbi:hypothetical protein B0T14DRAFT_523868, partial [Immersiella caudata]
MGAWKKAYFLVCCAPCAATCHGLSAVMCAAQTGLYIGGSSLIMLGFTFALARAVIGGCGIFEI